MPDSDPLQDVLAKLRADQASRVGRIFAGSDAETELGSVTLRSPPPEDLTPRAAATTGPQQQRRWGNPDQGARGKIEAPPGPGDAGAWLRGLYYAAKADQSALEAF